MQDVLNLLELRSFPYDLRRIVYLEEPSKPLMEEFQKGIIDYFPFTKENHHTQNGVIDVRNYLDRKGKWNQIVGYVTAIFGMFAIYSMASIYANSILPAWSDINTYLAFYGTTIVFGSVAMMMMLSFSKETEQEQIKKLIRIFSFVGLAAIIIQLVYLPVYTSSLVANGTNAGLESVALISSTFGVTTIIRWVATIIGLCLISWMLLKNTAKINYGYIVTAFAFVLVGEFLGRFIFYSIGVKIIVG